MLKEAISITVVSIGYVKVSIGTTVMTPEQVSVIEGYLHNHGLRSKIGRPRFKRGNLEVIESYHCFLHQGKREKTEKII